MGRADVRYAYRAHDDACGYDRGHDYDLGTAHENDCVNALQAGTLRGDGARRPRPAPGAA